MPPQSELSTPPFPYGVGETFTIRQRDPPAPYGKVYNEDHEDPDPQRVYVDNRIVQTRSKIEHVLSRPMLSGLRGTYGTPATLKITGNIRVSVEGRAQIVFCTVESPDPDAPIARQPAGSTGKLIAKIWDPLYWDPSTGEYAGGIEDYLFDAEAEYSREAAAYIALRGKDDVHGVLTPEFYGCWTLSAELAGRTREVRLILIEHLHMYALNSFDPLWYEDHPHILARVINKVVEIGVLLRHYGVEHGDVAPRNAVVDPGDLQDPNLVVKLFDFSEAKSVERQQPATRCMSRAVFWLGHVRRHTPGGFEGDWRTDDINRWLCGHWAKPSDRYEPTPDWARRRLLNLPEEREN